MTGYGSPRVASRTWLVARSRPLDGGYRAWTAGVRSLDPDGLAAPAGPAEGPWADERMAALVPHINREALHHLAEIALLRELYARQPHRRVSSSSDLHHLPGDRLTRPTGHGPPAARPAATR
jgi:hypothetical protein